MDGWETQQWAACERGEGGQVEQPALSVHCCGELEVVVLLCRERKKFKQS